MKQGNGRISSFSHVLYPPCVCKVFRHGICERQSRLAFYKGLCCSGQKTEEKYEVKPCMCNQSIFLTAETKPEKAEQELSGQPGSPKQPLQPAIPAPQQECQSQEQEPRKRDEGREQRPSQERRSDMDQHQEMPPQRQPEEATPQDGGGSRSE